jgi:hypothetical protein
MTTYEHRLVDQPRAETTIRSATPRKSSAQARQSRDPVGWIGLAASPTFALMAWISAGDASQAMICSSLSDQLPITDMAWMYLLMSLFHLSPWLKRAHACSHHFTLGPKGD